MSAQPLLIPDAVPAAAAERVPGKRGRRGRGATPQVDFRLRSDKPNPAGRYELRYLYRPLQRFQQVHPPSSLTYDAEARNLVLLYFKCFGGFRVASDQIMRVWCAALEDFTAQEIEWAILSKAESMKGATPEETAAKRMFAAQPVSFALNKIAYWLEKSAQYQRRLKAQRAAALHESIGQRVAERLAADRAAAQNNLEVLNRRHAERQAETQRIVAQREAADLAYWRGLTDSQRRAAHNAVLPDFKQYAACMGKNHEDPQLDDLLRAWCIDWALKQWPPQTGTAP